MRSSSLGALAAGAVVLAALSFLAVPTRGPPVSTAPRPAPVVEATPAGVLCVTTRGYCTSPPRPLHEPCRCAEPWAGDLPGRISGADPERAAASWPERTATEEDEEARGPFADPR